MRPEQSWNRTGFFPSGPVRSGRIQNLSGPVRLKSGRFIFGVKLAKIRQKSVRFIFDVKLTKIRQKSGFVQPDELAKIRFRPTE
jgi:hypothetical protein